MFSHAYQHFGAVMPTCTAVHYANTAHELKVLLLTDVVCGRSVAEIAFDVTATANLESASSLCNRQYCNVKFSIQCFIKTKYCRHLAKPINSKILKFRFFLHFFNRCSNVRLVRKYRVCTLNRFRVT